MYDILRRCFGVQKLFSDFWGIYLFCACSLYVQLEHLNTPMYTLPLPPDYDSWIAWAAEYAHVW